MKMAEWNRNKKMFKDIHNFGYPYFHIHPYKQKTVKVMVDNINANIDYLIIFGRSVQDWHMWWKDLDYCIIGDSKIICIPKTTEHTYHCLDYKDLDCILQAKSYSDVKYHIKTEGVMVYEKN